MCLDANGKQNGEALVCFVNKEHRDMALKRHKHHIGQRYIEVRVATKNDFIAATERAENETNEFSSKGTEVVVRMKGLPYECTAKQVVGFLFDV